MDPSKPQHRAAEPPTPFFLLLSRSAQLLERPSSADFGGICRLTVCDSPAVFADLDASTCGCSPLVQV